MKLSPKDLSAIRLNERYRRRDLEENRAEHFRFTDTLLYLFETLHEAKTPIQEWQKHAEPLVLKFCLHAFSIYNITGGNVFNSAYFEQLNTSKIIDISSARVVLRAQLETFLMFHYIYVNPKNDEDKILRYYAWIYSALLQRQSFPTLTEQNKKKLIEEKAEVLKLRELISNLPSFKKLTEKQRVSLLNSGNGKLFNNWSNILTETGFRPNHVFNRLFEYLSMYAHSEGLSVIQLSDQKLSYDKNHEQANLELVNSKLLVCLMITTILELFGITKIKYNTLDSNLRDDIEIYSQMAKGVSL